MCVLNSPQSIVLLLCILYFHSIKNDTQQCLKDTIVRSVLLSRGNNIVTRTADDINGLQIKSLATMEM